MDEPFTPEVEEDEVETPASVNTGVSDTTEATGTTAESETPAATGFERRMLDGKWIGKYKSVGTYLQYVDNQWVGMSADDQELYEQLWMEQEAQEIQEVNGVKMKWNAETEQWEKYEQIDDDFIAAYQAGYGVSYDYDKMTEEFRKEQAAKPKPEPEEDKDKKGKKRKMPTEPQPVGWVDMDEKVNAVYVSNLPLELELDEFKEFMAKAGVIQLDARTHKPKLKLYRDDLGGLKGDGRCCYVRKESVDIALSILDGAPFKDKTVSVEKAHFELKGEFDPTKKPKKMTAAQKKSYMERQNKIFEWKPDKPRNYRPISDCTVIIKNMFTIDEMNTNPQMIFDLKKDLEQSCSKFGAVKKVTIYDNNPDGVCSVMFETTDESDMAVKMLNGRLVKGRPLEAHLWDGRTKYKREETEEQRAKRLAEWDKFVGKDEDEESGSESSENEEKEGPTNEENDGKTG